MDSQGLGELIFHLPADTKKRVRYLEKCYFKLCKQKSSMLFNQTCIKENILPIYTNIKLHDEAAKNEPFTLEFRRRLIQ